MNERDVLENLRSNFSEKIFQTFVKHPPHILEKKKSFGEN